MAGEVDEAKGRIKKAVGELTDDDEMKRQGEIDQAAGKAKGAIDKVADEAEGAIQKVADKLQDVADKK